MKVFDENGNELTGYLSPDELAAKVTEETGKVKAELEPKLKEFETNLAKATKDLEEYKGTGEGRSIGKLREAKEKAEKDLEDFKGTVMKELGTIKGTMDDTQLLQRVNLLVDGDAELAKKVKIQYESIVKSEDTQEAKDKKLADAYKLVVGSSPSQGILNRVLGSGGGAPDNGGGGAGQWPQNLVELGAKLGLTQKDFENKNYIKR